MKITTHLIALTTFALVSVPCLPAQVPGIITYQGRVTSHDTNFSGIGQFRFALLNATNGQSLWSNDGTSVNGSQPTAPVSVSVADGQVTVPLGDTNLLNMQVIPASTFLNGDVRLRLWFDDGASGVAQLSPDQRITSVGYAMMSANVPDGAITGTKLAAGVLTPTNFPPNSVTSAELADTIALGASDAYGRLDIYHTGTGSPSITLLGNGSQIQTFDGSDGSELIRLWGSTYGELLLKDSVGHQTAVTLSANGNAGAFLRLNNSNGVARARLSGENVGGALTLYQADGSGVGALLDGNDGTGAGLLSLYQSDGALGLVLYGQDSGTGAGALSLRNAAGNPRLRAYGGSTSGSLEINQADGNLGLHLVGDNGVGGALGVRNATDHTTVLLHNVSSAGVVSARNPSGGEALYLWGTDSAGTGGGQLGLKQADGTETLTMQATEGGTGGSQIIMRNGAGTAATVEIDGEVGVGGGGYIALRNSANSAVIVLNADNGTVSGQVIEITGGSDLSENFDVNGGLDELQPGMIVSIDPQNPGELVLCAKAYDKKVAGILSGAGGVKPGMRMGQRGSVADGKHPVALTGRVYCWIDADAGGAIEPGDLITTSATLGHGMKASEHERASGAIIGKAMTSLHHGQGLVLILVSLQ
jgi:hypothetical protein